MQIKHSVKAHLVSFGECPLLVVSWWNTRRQAVFPAGWCLGTRGDLQGRREDNTYLNPTDLNLTYLKQELEIWSEASQDGVLLRRQANKWQDIFSCCKGDIAQVYAWKHLMSLILTSLINMIFFPKTDHLNIKV